MVFAVTGCGSASENAEEPASEETETAIADGEALSDADFIATANWDTEAEEMNIIDKFKNGEPSWYFYYVEGEDSSREGVIKTARGTCLGDVKDDVMTKYGEAIFEGDVDLENVPEAVYLYLQDDGEDALADQFEKEAASYAIYQMNEYQIAFYFDSSDSLTWVAFYNWDEE